MRVLVLLAAATACMGMPGFSDVRGGGQTLLGDIVQEFGLDVSVELQRGGTMAISPLSISSLLSVLMMGTEGRSNLELRRALRIPDNMSEEDVHLAFKGLMETLTRTGPDVTLNVANGLFLQTGSGIINEYTQKARTHYKSVVHALNFRNNSGQATHDINKWVKQSTNGMIPELYTQPLSPDTTFVAVNTVFFNGKWHTPFLPIYTTEQEFDTGNGMIKVPMMSGTVPVDYIVIPELDAHMAAFPYKGGRQSMFIILPKGPVTSDLEPLEQELSAERINGLIRNMTTVEMRVWVPRMRLSFKSQLKNTLINLRVRSIFDQSTANFTRLSREPVFVDSIVHETVIEITEEGTKAAAATGSDLNRMGSSRIFVVNRPAIIFIRDMESGMPLFWAKLVKPEPIRTAADATASSTPF